MGPLSMLHIGSLCLILQALCLAHGQDIELGDRIAENIKPLREMGGIAAVLNSSIDSQPDAHFCGAALISERWLLTAAHCIVGDIRSYNIILGIEDLNTTAASGDIYQVEVHLVHHAYGASNNAYNDIALLKTNRDVHTTKSVFPFCLPTPDLELPSFQSVQIAGWGHEDLARKPTKLKTNQIYLLKESACESTWREYDSSGFDRHMKNHYPEGIKERILCAGKEGVDQCRGDSGGPMVYKNNKGQMTLLGIISKGIETCPSYPVVPSFYTRVAYFVDWIYTITGIPRKAQHCGIPASLIPPMESTTVGYTTPVQSTTVDHITPVESTTIGHTTPVQSTTVDHTAPMQSTTVSPTTAEPITETTDEPICAFYNLTNCKVPTINNLCPIKCKQANAECSPACQRGSCNGPNRCGCNPAWTTERCNKEFYSAASSGDISFITGELSALSSSSSGLDLAWQNKDDYDYTALHEATYQDHPSVVQALLDANMNPNMKSAKGLTPVYIAASLGLTSVLEILLKPVYRADANLASNTGITPVYAAAAEGHAAALALLVAHNADVNKLRHSGTSPLGIAAEKGYVGAVRTLLDAGAIIDYAKPSSGDTALHTAAFKNQTDVVRLLLQKGADTKIKNKWGNTAADVARRDGYDSVARLIDNY